MTMVEQRVKSQKNPSDVNHMNYVQGLFQYVG
jgi:hypothetical protein